MSAANLEPLFSGLDASDPPERALRPAAHIHRHGRSSTGFERAAGCRRAAVIPLLGLLTLVCAGAQAQRTLTLTAETAGLHHETIARLGATSSTLEPGLVLHGNLGWLRKGAAGPGSVTWSLSVVRSAEGSLAADVYADDRNSQWVSAGDGMAILEKLTFKATFTRQLEGPRARQLSIGLKLQF